MRRDAHVKLSRLASSWIDLQLAQRTHVKHRLIAHINIAANEITGAIPTSIAACSSPSEPRRQQALWHDHGRARRPITAKFVGHFKEQTLRHRFGKPRRTEPELSEHVRQSARGGPAGGARHLGLWGTSKQRRHVCQQRRRFLCHCSPGNHSRTSARTLVTYLLAGMAIELAVLGMSIFMKRPRPWPAARCLPKRCPGT
jgi:hypothetical protein